MKGCSEKKFIKKRVKSVHILNWEMHIHLLLCTYFELENAYSFITLTNNDVIFSFQI